MVTDFFKIKALYLVILCVNTHFVILSEYTSSPEPAPYGSVPYIARPHPEQASHTG